MNRTSCSPASGPVWTCVFALALALVLHQPAGAQRAAELLGTLAEPATDAPATGQHSDFAAWWASSAYARVAYTEHYASNGAAPPDGHSYDVDTVVQEGLLVLRTGVQRDGTCVEATVAAVPYSRSDAPFPHPDGFQCGFAALPEGTQSLAHAEPAAYTTVSTAELPVACGGTGSGAVFCTPASLATQQAAAEAEYAASLAAADAEAAAVLADQAAARFEMVENLRDFGARCHAPVLEDNLDRLVRCVWSETELAALQAQWEPTASSDEQRQLQAAQLDAFLADGGVEARVAEWGPALQEFAVQWPLMITMGEGVLLESIRQAEVPAARKQTWMALVRVAARVLPRMDLADPQRLHTALAHLATALRESDQAQLLRLESLSLEQASIELTPLWRGLRRALQSYGIDLHEIARSMHFDDSTEVSADQGPILRFQVDGAWESVILDPQSVQ